MSFDNRARQQNGRTLGAPVACGVDDSAAIGLPMEVIRMRRFLILTLLSFSMASTVVDADMPTYMKLQKQAEPLTADNSTISPSVYFSDGANHCFPIAGTEYWIFVHSPDDEALKEVSFDLELQGTGIGTPLVIPENGVILGAIDVSASPYHIEASWTTRPLDQTPMIRLVYPTQPLWSGFQMPVAVVFRRGDGSEVPGVGVWSFGGGVIDCFPCSFGFFLESHSLIPVGSNTTIPFEWSWYCWTVGGGDLTVSDTEGWVVSWSPPSVGGASSCEQCFEARYPGSIDVLIPPGVPEGTTSTMTLSALSSYRDVTIEAVAPVPVEESTWGAIKSIYR